MGGHDMRWLRISILASTFLWGVVLRGGVSAASVFVPGITAEEHGGRPMLVHVPSHLPPQGSRALVVVLHGGLGNARNIESGKSESGLNLDAMADHAGFIVAYLSRSHRAF